MDAKVLREIEKNISVEDPYQYIIERQIINCIKVRRPYMLSVFEGSSGERNMSNNIYWKRVEYAFLPKKEPMGHPAFYRSSIPLVWFEYIAKHTKLVN